MAETQSLDPQPKDTQDLLRTIHPLTDERRIEARERARALVVKAAGTKPERKDYNTATESKYPIEMTTTINALCLMVLLAAFLPSAIRLYHIGSTTFYETLPDTTSANAAGLSIVIMAEISMVLFSIASVVMESHRSDGVPSKGRVWLPSIDGVKTLLMVSQLVATAIAVAGNAQVSLPGHENNLFALIEAFTPSIVVFTTSTILKAQMLTAIERSHANARAYAAALNAWTLATSQTERDPAYRPALHNALRDFIREDNLKGTGATARREYMAGLILPDWRVLVKRELMADEWYTDPDAQTVSVVPVSVQTTHRQTTDTRQRVYTPMSSETTDSRRQTGNGQVSYEDSVSVQTDEDTQPTDIRQSGAGFVRVSTAVEIAKKWLADNPDKANLSLRTLEEMIGVGKDSIAKARKDMERGG